MKRLYVRPEGRGHALGDYLIESIMDHAKASGYKEMVLDTIELLQTAIHLYKKHGFVECEPYYYNPMADVIYMRKELTE
ncbi:GNAT family N-acetyltransferase [Veillonella sp.]|uniref:GNAT family N-acetyltransferase n=1 Tax=Veillonella sp. TaxID=1926307 RepID=UPI0025F3B0FC|nr:GNAT family N-acetyltransferase [Veillonella sp.]